MPELTPLPQEPRAVNMDNFFRDDGNSAGNHLGDTIANQNQAKAAADAIPRTAQQVFESVLTKPEHHELADEFEFVAAPGSDGEIHRHWQTVDPARRGHDPYEQVEPRTVEQWRRQLVRHEEPEPKRLHWACCSMEGGALSVNSLKADTAQRVNAAKLDAELASPLPCGKLLLD